MDGHGPVADGGRSRSRRLACIIATIGGVLLLLPLVAGAQVAVPSWDLVLPDEHDERVLLDAKGKGEIVVHVVNDQPLEMVVSLEVDLPWGDHEDPDDVVVAAGSEEEVVIEVRGGDPNTRSALSQGEWTVTAVRVSLGGVPDVLGDQREVTGDLVNPRIIRLIAERDDVNGPLRAGQTMTVEVSARNDGNGLDSVVGAAATDNCPQLQVNGASALDGVRLGSRFDAGSNITEATLTLDTASSHPARTCTITLSLRSQADVDAGRSRIADDVRITVRVLVAHEDEDTPKDPGPVDQDIVVEAGFLPAPALSLAVLSVLAAALVSRRR